MAIAEDDKVWLGTTHVLKEKIDDCAVQTTFCAPQLIPRDTSH